MNIFDSFLVKKYIAHRGLWTNEIPENSLAAFKNARDKGVPFECDLHMLDDGTIVVFHDETLGRMTGKDGYLKHLKKEELKNHPFLNSKEIIPTLDALLLEIKGKVPILFEIKNGGEAVGELEKKFMEKMKSYSGEFAVMSFNPYVVKWFKDNAPNVIRGQLSSFFKKDKMSPARRFALKRMLFNNKTMPHFIAYHHKDLPNRFVKKYNNLPLLAWSVNNDEDFYKVVKHCDNIIFESFDIYSAM